MQDGTAPLWIASQMGHSEVVRVMLLRGAERDATRKVSVQKPVHGRGYAGIVRECGVLGSPTCLGSPLIPFSTLAAEEVVSDAMGT